MIDTLPLLIETHNPDVHVGINTFHLNIRMWQESIGQNKFANILDSQDDLTRISEYYSGGQFFVATIDSQIVGFVGLRMDGPEEATLMRMAVVPEHQHTGIGTALVSVLVAWAEDHGYRTLRLTTNIKEKGRPLYERFGFVVVGHDPVANDWKMLRTS